MKLVSLESIYRNGYCFSCLSIDNTITYEHVFIEDSTISGLQKVFGNLENASTINFTMESDTIKVGKIFVPYYSYDCGSTLNENRVKLQLDSKDFVDFIACLDKHMVYALMLVYCKNIDLRCFYVVSGDTQNLIPDYQLSEEMLVILKDYFRDSISPATNPFTEIDGVTIAVDTIKLLEHCKLNGDLDSSVMPIREQHRNVLLSDTFSE